MVNPTEPIKQVNKYALIIIVNGLAAPPLALSASGNPFFVRTIKIPNDDIIKSMQ